MPEHFIFHVVFLSQILLISLYYPRTMLARMTYVFETYPPSTYPKLYPKPFAYYERARRTYRIMNRFILLAGLSVLGVMLVYPRSGEWDHVIALWFFLLQFIPVMLLDFSTLKALRLMRDADSRTTRKAELHPRRFFDFVSPAMIGGAIFTYIAFIILIAYVRQFGFPWFGGYWNVFGVTMMNLFFVGIMFRRMYGKKLNPHQTHEDRIKQIQIMARILLFASIAATVFIALAVVLAAYDLRHVQPVAESLYFQLLAVVCFQAYRIETLNFEVYKEDPVIA